MRICFFLLFLCASVGLLADEQDGAEQDGIDFVGTLVDEHHNPVPFATVRLLRADSSFIKATVSSLSGDFLIRTQVPPGEYLLAFSSLDYQREMVTVSISSDGMFMLSTIVLRQLSKELSEAVVVGQRKFIERDGNKMTINVEANQMSATSNGLDLLQTAPGVVLNRQTGSIQLNGRSGVVVQLNGRSVRYSSEQLAEFLANMSGSSISKIEVLATPSASADAEGGGGIINIILKTPVADGVNGECTVAAGYGENPRGKTAALLNYHRNTFSLFSDVSAQYDKYTYTENGTRWLLSQGDSIFFNNSLHRTRVSTPVSFRIGSEFVPDTANRFSTVFLINYSRTVFDNTSQNRIHGNGSTVIDQLAHLQREGFDVLSNVAYEHRFPELKGAVQLNVDYFYSNNSRNNTYSGFQEAANSLWRYNNPIHNQLQVVTGQIDYQQPINERLTMSIGTKNTTTLRADKNDFIVVSQQGRKDQLPDNQRFSFLENIQAFYVQMDEKFRLGWKIVIGLRSEILKRTAKMNDSLQHTTTEMQLFPSASISYSRSEKWVYNLSYSRRISRPPYKSLSPQRLYSDPYTSMYGNPQLKPQIDNVFSFSATLFKYVTLSPSVTISQNPFATLFYQNDSTMSLSSITSNMRQQNSYAMLTNCNMPLKKWWTVNISCTLGYDDLQLEYQQQLYAHSYRWCSLQAQSQWMLPKNWSLQCDFWRISDVNQGFYNIKALGAMGISVKKNIGSTSLVLQMNDIFHTFIENKSADFFNYHYRTNGSSDTRQVWISVKHRFGNKKLAKSSKRNYDASEIKQRAGE